MSFTHSTFRVLLLALGLFASVQSQANGFCNLVWSDEFDGATLSSQWTKEVTCSGGGNAELECYTARDKNVFLNNGSLVLKAFRETYTGSQAGCTDSSGCTNTKTYTSGRVNTAASNSWLYGRFETRAKLPSGTLLWPAIWMLPTDYAYGGWAASGEIDIMESKGNDPSLCSGTLHHGAPWPNNVWTTTGDHGVGVDMSLDYHVFALEWTATTMNWYIDSTLTQSFNLNRWWNSTVLGVYSAMGQPWNKRFHFIMNLAVGGNFFGGATLTDAQSAAWKQPELRIDYVRVWQQGGNCAAATTAASTRTTQAADGANRASTTPTSNAATTSATNNGRCNNQPYDPNLYTCTINNLGAQVLCPILHSSCGNACYPTNNYCCVSGNLLAKNLCPTTSSARPATSTSSSTTATCNGQTYATSAFDCTTNDQGRKVLCPKNQLPCGTACYSSTSFCCKNGGLIQKPAC